MTGLTNLTVFKETAHSHAPDPIESEIAILRTEVRRLAGFSTLKPSQIVNKVTRETNSALLADLQSENAMKQAIKRVRKKTKSNLVGEPKSVVAFDIPDKFKQIDSEYNSSQFY